MTIIEIIKMAKEKNRKIVEMGDGIVISESQLPSLIASGRNRFRVLDMQGHDSLAAYYDENGESPIGSGDIYIARLLK